MALPRARSIDELYEEVRGCDLVLTTDAPLGLALNRRLDEPTLGHFATTPRGVASGEFRPRDDRALFLAVIEETGLSWKHASFLVGVILSCWEETGRVDTILEFEQFDTPATREVLDVIRGADSAHGDLASHSIPDDPNVAVIGEAAFTELDQSILPAEYETVDPFGAESVELPDFHVYGSATAIVDAVVGNVSPEAAENVAVVMDRGSQYPSLVEAAFEAAGIPYYGGPGFADDPGLRTFLRLLRVGVTAAELRVSDVRPILGRLSRYPSASIDEYRVSEIQDAAVTEVMEFCEGVEELTFGEALDGFAEWDGELPEFRDELAELGVVDELVTEARVNGVEYYLDAFDLPVERDDSGVLLAGATAAAYVDRPVVFYLGMDAGWTQSIPDRPWIDREAKDAAFLRQFQRLIQNGDEQYLLVQNSTAGKPVTPCLYFNDVIEEAFEEFEDLPHVPHTVIPRDGGDGFARESLDVEVAAGTVEMLSQSSLNRLVNCPRDYFFDRVVEERDSERFRKGMVFHDFAEFYVAHPDVVADVGVDAVVEVMLEALSVFPDTPAVEPLETECRVGAELLMGVVDTDPPSSPGSNGYVKRDDDSNLFAEAFDVPIESEVTELWFEDPDLGGKGKIDLLHGPDRLVDYKSGSQKTASKVIGNAAIEEVGDEPDFQAPLYLAKHRREHDGRIEFAFLHFLELVDEAITGTGEDGYIGDGSGESGNRAGEDGERVINGDVDFADAFTTVTYHPMSFAEFVATHDAFDALCAGVAESNNRRKTLERLGFDAYAAFFAEHSYPDPADKDEVVASDVTEAFVAYARDAVGEYKYVTKGCRSAMKKLYDVRGRNFFAEEIDAFEAFLQENRDAVNEHRGARFPVGDPNYDRVDHRDCILTETGVRGDE